MSLRSARGKSLWALKDNGRVQREDENSVTVSVDAPISNYFRPDSRLGAPDRATFLEAVRAVSYSAVIQCSPHNPAHKTYLALSAANRRRIEQKHTNQDPVPSVSAPPPTLIQQVRRIAEQECRKPQYRDEAVGVAFAQLSQDWTEGLQEDQILLRARRAVYSEIRRQWTRENRFAPLHPLDVPRRAMAEILALVKEAGEDSAISFSSDDNHLFFALGSRVLIARKLAGNFPDYGRVLPQKFESTAVADRAELQAALSRAKVFADERTNSVCLDFASGQLTITAKTFETGENEEAVPIEYSGCSVQIGFNATYLLEFLSAAGSEKVCVGLSGTSGAAQFAPVLESPDGYKYVVMPMRI